MEEPAETQEMVSEHDDFPNPFSAEAMWGDLPGDRTWGAISAIYPAADGKHLGPRSGAARNFCGDRPEVDTVVLFSREGEALKSFGAGLIAWPHGMFVDHEGNVWVTDAKGFVPDERVPEGLGHFVIKFSPEGQVLMRLGEPGMAGTEDGQFQHALGRAGRAERRDLRG